MFNRRLNAVSIRQLFALCTALGLSACGGGSGGSAGTPTPPVVISSSPASSTSSNSSLSLISSASSILSSSSSSSISSQASSRSSIASSAKSSSSSAPAEPIQMGGAIQGRVLNPAALTSTLAGAVPWADGISALARFKNPYGSATDGTNLYVADHDNRTIRKVVIATGAVTTLAGKATEMGTTDGTGSAARFCSPSSIALVGAYLYVADMGCHTIRKVSIATGEVTTLAGTATVEGSIDGTGTAAKFNTPLGITSDGTNLYVTEQQNHTIRKIVIATGAVSTLAGSTGVAGSADGTGAAANFKHPAGIANDGTNLYVVDGSNYTIRKIVIATGAVTTLAGKAGYGWNDDGVGENARFYAPFGIVLDGANLYVGDVGNTIIRKIVIATATVSTFAGSSGNRGNVDGIGAAATFSSPFNLSSDGTYLYVTDANNNNIRKIAIATGAVTTLAGRTLNESGTGATANFNLPYSTTTDGTHLYIVDYHNQIIRRVVIATGVVTTFAGTRTEFGEKNDKDGIGTNATFNNPYGITTDGTNLYVTDTNNHTIRKIVMATAEVSTLAGESSAMGTSDGIGAAARFNYPLGITTDGTNLYVVDQNISDGSTLIRKIVIATKAVSTLAGKTGAYGDTDGTGAAASFYSPAGITTDGTNLYLADKFNHSIRKIVIATGAVTTLAGTSQVSGTTDGTGAAARFYRPSGITSDGTHLYVTDTYNQTIRKIVIATGEVTTLTGTSGSVGNSDGLSSNTKFNYPVDITTDGFSLFITDSSNNLIRKID